MIYKIDKASVTKTQSNYTLSSLDNKLFVYSYYCLPLLPGLKINKESGNFVVKSIKYEKKGLPIPGIVSQIQKDDRIIEINNEKLKPNDEIHRLFNEKYAIKLTIESEREMISLNKR